MSALAPRNENPAHLAILLMFTKYSNKWPSCFDKHERKSETLRQFEPFALSPSKGERLSLYIVNLYSVAKVAGVKLFCWNCSRAAMWRFPLVKFDRIQEPVIAAGSISTAIKGDRVMSTQCLYPSINHCSDGNA